MLYAAITQLLILNVQSFLSAIIVIPLSSHAPQENNFIFRSGPYKTFSK